MDGFCYAPELFFEHVEPGCWPWKDKHPVFDYSDRPGAKQPGNCLERSWSRLKNERANAPERLHPEVCLAGARWNLMVCKERPEEGYICCYCTGWPCGNFFYIILRKKPPSNVNEILSGVDQNWDLRSTLWQNFHTPGYIEALTNWDPTHGVFYVLLWDGVHFL